MTEVELIDQINKGSLLYPGFAWSVYSMLSVANILYDQCISQLYKVGLDVKRLTNNQRGYGSQV